MSTTHRYRRVVGGNCERSETNDMNNFVMPKLPRSDRYFKDFAVVSKAYSRDGSKL